jgi:hypothetical protein
MRHGGAFDDATDTIGVVFTNTVARISGIGAKNFLLGASSTAFQMLRSVVYLENSAFTGTNVASDQEWLAFPADHTILKIGGTITVTNGGLLNSANYAQVNFRTPAGRASITGSVSGTFAGVISSNENSYVAVDGPTMAFSGSGTYSIFWHRIIRLFIGTTTQPLHLQHGPSQRTVRTSLSLRRSTTLSWAIIAEQ